MRAAKEKHFYGNCVCGGGQFTLYPQAVRVVNPEGGVQNPKYHLPQRREESCGEASPVKSPGVVGEKYWSGT